MAFKSVKNITLRNQGTLVSNIKNLISSKSILFPIRSRKYIKDILQSDGNVYWLVCDKSLSAIAFVEPKYRFEIDGLHVVTIGHLIANNSCQVDSILTHILGDNQEYLKIIFMRPTLAQALDLQVTYKFFELNPLQLKQYWPSLANLKTDYFNSTEFLAEALELRKMNIYLRIEKEDYSLVKNRLPQLANLLKL